MKVPAIAGQLINKIRSALNAQRPKRTQAEGTAVQIGSAPLQFMLAFWNK
ncbi:hypothetical protein NKJ06_22960 [Mesorhizobium sp. M0293]